MNRRAGLGFALLCLLLGSEWLADVVAPRAMPGLWGAAVRFALLGSGFLLASRRRGTRTHRESKARSHGWPTGGQGLRVWKLALFGGILLGLLPIVSAGAERSVTSLTLLLLPAIIPAFVVFLVAQREEKEFRLLVPALAAFAGSALLVAYTLPASARAWVWLAGAIVAALVAGWALLHMHDLLAGEGLLRAAGIASLGCATLMICFCWMSSMTRPVFGVQMCGLALTRLLLLDAPGILLTIFLVREMKPSAYSTRYVLALFVAVAESFAMVRPPITWSMVLAVLLICGGCFVLLRAPGSDPEMSKR